MSKEFLGPRNTTYNWQTLPPQTAMGLTYDDVLITPRTSEVDSRKDVDTSIQFGPVRLGIPLISAPMDTVSGEQMIKELSRLGALGSLPRYNGDNNLGAYLNQCEKFSSEGVPCLYAVGIASATRDARLLRERGAQMILIDVAHGGMKRVVDVAKQIKDETGLFVVAGSIADFEQAQALKESGDVDVARVGVGPGGVCTTRLVAGTGLAQMSAVFDTTESGIAVIADGGITKPGDIAKAIAGGACAIMVGSYLAGTDEAPGKIEGNGKVLRGQASEEYMKENGTPLGEHREAEGVRTIVPLKGPVERLLYGFSGGLRSAMSYTGARNIREFQERARFAIVSPSTQRENKPHASF